MLRRQKPNLTVVVCYCIELALDWFRAVADAKKKNPSTAGREKNKTNLVSIVRNCDLRKLTVNLEEKASVLTYKRRY